MQRIAIHWRTALAVGIALGAASAQAQPDMPASSNPLPIRSITSNPLVLYAEPSLSAAQQKIPVPEQMGSDWQVLGTQQQFYRVQAGSAQGWVRRSHVRVQRGVGQAPALCNDTTSTTQGPTGTSPGMGQGC